MEEEDSATDYFCFSRLVGIHPPSDGLPDRMISFNTYNSLLMCPHPSSTKDIQ